MTPETANPLMQLAIPYALIFMIFYFLVFRPRKREQNQRKQLLLNLKKNDEIVTLSGIHATVSIVKDKTVIVRIDDNARMEVDKEAIATVTKHADGQPAK